MVGETQKFSGRLSSRSMHICVDMQRLFSTEGPWPTPWLDRTLPSIVRLSERRPGNAIYTRFIPPTKPEDMTGQWQRYYREWANVTRERLDPKLLDLVPPLDGLSRSGTVVDKPVYSPFHGWRLPALLRERQADALIVSGGETDVCVLATILGAVDHGYRTVLAVDAVCSSSDEGHEALLTLFRTRFSLQVEVATVEDVLAAW